MMPGLDPQQFGRVVARREEQNCDPATSVCLACVEVLGVAGAGLVLMSAGQSRCLIGVSDPVTATVEQIEYTLGEGPCVAAARAHAPVFDPDLTDEETGRWPEFRRSAIAAGVRAAFGFPLLIERICIGALNIYDDQPGALTDTQVADAVMAAEFASRAVLAWQAQAPPGTLAWQLERAPNHLVEVHQATGRISAQLGLSVDDALVVLRAHAFSHDRPIADVAADIAAGRLRLD